MNSLSFVIFLVIYLSLTYFYKVIDHITDFFVEKTFKNKKGILKYNGKSIFFPLFGIAPFKDISADFFDMCVVKWGVSRDFLVFKDLIGQSTGIEKRHLEHWESVFNGGDYED